MVLRGCLLVMGLGVASVGSQLASETSLFDEDKDIFSFHNFFLEMLVDIGIIPFFIIMLAYLRLAFGHYHYHRKTGAL